MEEKYWKYINFVGHMEHQEHDAEVLLRKIGAWDTYGTSGWGDNGTEHVFQTSGSGLGRRHATGARDKLKQYLTPADEAALEEWYAQDYANPVLGIVSMQIFAESYSAK